MANRQREIREAFEIFDKNHDGFISAKELKAALRNLGDKLSKGEVAEMIAVADKDGDGRVNYMEFLNLFVDGRNDTSINIRPDSTLVDPETVPLNNLKSPSGNIMTKSKRSRQERGFFYWRKIFSGHHLLTTLTVISTVLSAIIGLLIRNIGNIPPNKFTPRQLMYIQFPGDLFLRMLKMLIIPLLTCSIISAIGSLDLSLSKKIGFQSIMYYVFTTSIAVVQGIFWVLLVTPGKYASFNEFSEKDKRNITTVDTMLDLIRNLFPANIVEACTAQDRTTLIYDEKSNQNISDIYSYTPNLESTRGTNVLGLVAFSIALGITIARLGKAGEPFLKMIDSLGEAVMYLTKAVIWISPIGVFFLVLKNILEVESFTAMVAQLGLYFVTVLVGLLVHGFITVPSIYLVCLRKFPFKFIMNMSPAIVTAFGTASSSASLPVSMHCLEERNKIDVRVSRFVMPIGATINMDGTALYEAVAAIFISQVRHIPLSFGSIVAVSITATMASIGAAGIPQAGLVTMVMVLDTVGLPAGDVSMILAVDWLLDRFRTVVNVLGDAIGAGIIAKFSKDELQKMDEMMTNKSPVAASNSENAQSENWHTTPM